ncbi:MAG: RNA polymerase sigma-54 factor [Desulfobacterales bacterium SG8_35_2]|nr:MAG: RNA polymerase sigma-54 factor [Desulfobacterales bacterium SG8_35_2]
MSLALKQQLKLTQQLLMTPQLQQAIKLLQLSRLELADTIRQEIEQNPLLEEISPGDSDYENSENSLSATEEIPDMPEPERTGEVNMDDVSSMQEINWEDDYANYYDAGFSFTKEAPEQNRLTQIDFLTKETNLQSHLQWQLAHTELSDELEETCLFVIGNLNPNGFLEVSVEDITREIGCDQETADLAIAIIQEMDPPGVAATNVQESLLLQLKRLGLEKSLAAEIIKDHLHSLELKNYGDIAKAVKRPIKEVLAAIEIITRLNPFPGEQYSERDVHYIIPDVFVHKVGDEYLIVLNDEGLPRLKVSSAYEEIVAGDANASAETKAYIKEKLRDAMWLIKSMQQRQRTIYKVVDSLLRFQKDFFEKGVQYLKPLVLRDVAEDIGMHESTVSRVTNNKYMHTPQGIFELKYFFSTAIPQQDGEALAAESIRQRIKIMIKNENPEKPLTDNAISKILTQENIKVARRTVAKYREQLGILPVKHRRKPKL